MRWQRPKGGPVLLFTHQLLHPWAGERPWHNYFRRGQCSGGVAGNPTSGGVRAIFQGHAHRLDVQVRTLGDHQACVFAVVPPLSTIPSPGCGSAHDPARWALQRLPLRDSPPFPSTVETAKAGDKASQRGGITSFPCADIIFSGILTPSNQFPAQRGASLCLQ